MTYTKQVREYCLNNQGTVLDVSLMKDCEFSEIPYKTLLKILNRLEEEKLISGISKGVYAIGKLNVQNEPDIMREYTGNGKGMIVGGIFYQGVDLSSYHPLVTEIYTNAMTSAQKNIGRFHLTRVNLEFTDSIPNGKSFIGHETAPTIAFLLLFPVKCAMMIRKRGALR